MDLQALALTLQLAVATTVILGSIGIPFAWWLSQTRWRGRPVIETVVTLPLVLPPTVLGFYLLWGMGPHSWFGRTLSGITGSRLPFTFAGILLASLICNLPFMLRPLMASFAGVPQSLIEASWCLGESRWGTFRRVTLPLCWPGILAALALTFAHTLGEFGVVLMVGGNIPGVTRTLSIAIYDDVQALDYASAGKASLVLLLVSLGLLSLVQWLGRREGSR